MFLGLELEVVDATGEMYIHQATFVRQLLTKHGLDKTSKSVTSITMAIPTPEDLPPTAAELKKLQGLAGELNWLATRTRADLAYFTSVIASSASAHGDWTLQLCKKVLRYLCGTVTQGIRYPRGGDETALYAWSDAGYGGPGMRSQTGSLIAWGGAVVVWRSSRQPVSALSTCEAEVAAAALTFQVVEGLHSLLLEWHVLVGPPVLLIDNKSALQVTEVGGTWRTRYFAVRAARLGEEHRRGHVVTLFCPTADMAADALTKMCTALVLDNLRRSMDAYLPALP